MLILQKIVLNITQETWLISSGNWDFNLNLPNSKVYVLPTISIAFQATVFIFTKGQNFKYLVHNKAK